MSLLADSFQIIVLITCLIGLALIVQKLFPEVLFPLIFCFAPVGLITVLFFIEHFIPLGQAHWLWLPVVVATVVLIALRKENVLREPVIWYFLFGFAVCFFWRFSFPDIHTNSERIADHAHLVSYSAGNLLPAEDVWMKGSKDNMYYIFQYYAAGLIHRWVGCSTGMTYHLGYCTLVGFAIAAIGMGVEMATLSRTAGILAAVTIALGGSGTTMVTPFMCPGGGAVWAAMRFIGSFGLPGHGLNSFGEALVKFIGSSPVDAPVEHYSYLIMLGDFHPSMSSLFFFGLVILAICAAERVEPNSLNDKLCVIAASATAILLLISNTWIAPLQIALVLCWLAYRWFIGRKDSWSLIIFSFVAPLGLIFPFFSQFAYETRNYGVHIEWVKQRVPFLNWLLVMLPACLCWAVGLWQFRRHSLARFATIVGLGAMIGTGFLYVHDMYGGPFAIFNTTLKWWPWVYALLLVLGITVCWPNRRLHIPVIVIVGLTLFGNLYTFFVCEWWPRPKKNIGRLDGYAWFTNDGPQKRAIYENLKTFQQGVVLESIPLDAGGPCITLAQFTGHYSLGGWIGHEMLWRGYRPDLLSLMEKNEAFYKGLLPDPLSWLNGAVAGGVNYIVWLDRDNVRTPGLWEKLNGQLEKEYNWHAIQTGPCPMGIWIKKF